MLIFLLYFVMSVVAAVSALFTFEKINKDAPFDPMLGIVALIIGFMWPLSIPTYFCLYLVLVCINLLRNP